MMKIPVVDLPNNCEECLFYTICKNSSSNINIGYNEKCYLIRLDDAIDNVENENLRREASYWT